MGKDPDPMFTRRAGFLPWIIDEVVVAGEDSLLRRGRRVGLCDAVLILVLKLAHSVACLLSP